MLTEDKAGSVASRLKGLYDTEKTRLDRVDSYMRGAHDGPYQPRTAGSEYRKLVQRATTNMLPLVVTVAAQALFVEGYRTLTGDPETADNNSVGWRTWQANGCDRRQMAVHRGALSYGTAYVTVLPGDPLPVVRGVSPRKMIAVYEDPAEDDWPLYALRVDGERFRLYDDENVYTLEQQASGMAVVKTQEHGAGVCPVVRFCDDLDLDGRSTGQVEPLLVMQDRLDQTVFDLLMTQTFASWKVRTIAGMDMSPDLTDAQKATLTEEQLQARKVRLSQDRWLVAEDEDTKFGTLDETPLDGFISAVELAVRQIATMSQTPPHHLLGQMANLSAEALAAAEAGLSRKVEELKHSFGESWEQVLRLASSLDGDEVGALDVSSQVQWRDMESRSLAQTADALGKIATMLGVPPQVLWPKLPGFTAQDVAEAKRIAESNDVLGQLTEALNRQTQPAQA